MKNHKYPAFILTAAALLLGLLLPMLTFCRQDATFARQSWPLGTDGAHYAYQGTLLNRVACLNAWLNASPAVRKSPDAAASVPSGLAESLSSLLPIGGPFTESACAFTLSPEQYAAEYGYLSIEYTSERACTSVVTDTETGLPLRIELTLSPDTLQDWLEDHGLWDILRGYASLLDLGEPTDGDTSISTVLLSQSTQLRGTPYCASVTVIPSAGTLLLKLTAFASH